MIVLEMILKYLTVTLLIVTLSSILTLFLLVIFTLIRELYNGEE
jgi:uncharacterized protein involved in exopolysaccharide biosynthesis